MKQRLIFLLLLCYQFAVGQSIENKLQQHQNAYHLEKIYVSHNQPYYSPGDTLFAKVFLVNGRTHQIFDGTPIVYVDWFSEGSIVEQSFILKITDGTANLSIPMPRDMEVGRYLLRAYTQYQKNFDDAFIFQKEIKIIGEKPLKKKENIGDVTDFSVKFYPEGGYMVSGLQSSVAFKAQNGKGANIDIQGVIINKEEEIIAQLKTLNEGNGVFNMLPKMGQKYRAKVSWGGLVRFFELPKMLKQGYVLMVNSRKKETITIQLTSNTEKGLAGCTLVGHLRGQSFLSQNFETNNPQKLSLDKTQIPSGLLHFTLFDEQQRPVGERLVFNNNPAEEVEVNIEIPQTNFSKRELVKAQISSNIGAKLTPSFMSATVFNNDIFSSSTNGVTIKNYLLLQSDLKGRINNINQYFEKNDAKSRTLLDYLLLTHGWRRFNWQEVLAEKPSPIIYPTEENISFAGSVKKDNKKQSPVKADVFLNILDKEHFASLNLTTEEDGLFYFRGFDLTDSLDILIQANIHNAKKKQKLKKGEAKRTGNKNVIIELLNLHEQAFNDSITLKRIPYNKQEQISFATEINRIRKVDTIYHPEWTINLDAITVKAQRLDDRRKRDVATKKMYKDRGLFYAEGTQKIYTEDIVTLHQYQNIFDLIQAKVPGATIITTEDGKQVLLRAQSSILNTTYAAIEVDGVLITILGADQILPENIALIDVKRGLYATAVYGERGNGGVISILTKEPGANSRKVHVPGILNIQHPGYHRARTFYAPNYAKTSIDNEKPDYRTTLYWNPDIFIKKESAAIEFYTGDKFSDFLILVEGITEEGIPFVGRKVITIGQ